MPKIPTYQSQAAIPKTAGTAQAPASLAKMPIGALSSAKNAWAQAGSAWGGLFEDLVNKHNEVKDIKAMAKTNQIIAMAGAEIDNFMAKNPDPDEWLPFAEKTYKTAQKELLNTKFSNEKQGEKARALALSKVQSGIAKVQYNAIKADTELARIALSSQLTEAYASGQKAKIIEAEEQWDQNKDTLYAPDAQNIIKEQLIEEGKKEYSTKQYNLLKNKAARDPETVIADLEKELDLRKKEGEEGGDPVYASLETSQIRAAIDYARSDQRITKQQAMSAADTLIIQNDAEWTALLDDVGGLKQIQDDVEKFAEDIAGDKLPIESQEKAIALVKAWRKIIKDETPKGEEKNTFSAIKWSELDDSIDELLSGKGDPAEIVKSLNNAYNEGEINTDDYKSFHKKIHSNINAFAAKQIKSYADIAKARIVKITPEASMAYLEQMSANESEIQRIDDQIASETQHGNKREAARLKEKKAKLEDVTSVLRAKSIQSSVWNWAYASYKKELDDGVNALDEKNLAGIKSIHNLLLGEYDVDYNEAYRMYIKAGNKLPNPSPQKIPKDTWGSLDPYEQEAFMNALGEDVPIDVLLKELVDAVQ